jgi:hypothetical protein
MSSSVTVIIRCDHLSPFGACTREVRRDYQDKGSLNATVALMLARRIDGWHATSRRAFCPEHSPKKAER